MLRLLPWAVKHALPFIEQTHRRLPDRQGAMWAVRVVHCMDLEAAQTIGVAVVGRAARLLHQDFATLEVLRVSVIEGNRNACSMLYGACSRMARAAGADNLVTYLHGDEHGASLRASGWVPDGMTDGGQWDRSSRPRRAVADALPKQRWWAAWSHRARLTHPEAPNA
jgi:hypothetical protein